MHSFFQSERQGDRSSMQWPTTQSPLPGPQTRPGFPGGQQKPKHFSQLKCLSGKTGQNWIGSGADRTRTSAPPWDATWRLTPCITLPAPSKHTFTLWNRQRAITILYLLKSYFDILVSLGLNDLLTYLEFLSNKDSCLLLLSPIFHDYKMVITTQ